MILKKHIDVIVKNMSLEKKINEDLKEAMKSKDEERVSSLRLLNSAIKNKLIEKKEEKEKGLDDGEVVKIVKYQIKQLRDAAGEFEKAGRDDLVKQNNKEIEILSVYLPEEMPEDAVRAIVKSKISELGEVSSADFGKVMGLVMKETGDAADGALVKKIVQEELNK